MNHCNHNSYESCLNADECAECLRIGMRDMNRLGAELARAKARLKDAEADLKSVKCGYATPKEARLQRELIKAKSENAGKLDRLRDLLGPTVELLEVLVQPHSPGIFRSDCLKELARLRAVMEGKQ